MAIVNTRLEAVVQRLIVGAGEDDGRLSAGEARAICMEIQRRVPPHLRRSVINALWPATRATDYFVRGEHVRVLPTTDTTPGANAVFDSYRASLPSDPNDAGEDLEMPFSDQRGNLSDGEPDRIVRRGQDGTVIL